MKIDIPGYALYLALHSHRHGTSWQLFLVPESQDPKAEDLEVFMEDFETSDDRIDVYGPIAVEDIKVIDDLKNSAAEANARSDYRTFLGQEIVVDDLLSGEDFDDMCGKFRVRVCQTGDDDIARVMDEYIDPIWNVELLEVLEGDQKAAWRAENLYYHAPSYLRSTGAIASDRDREQYQKLTDQLKKGAK